jgi:hypothetical protein
MRKKKIYESQIIENLNELIGIQRDQINTLKEFAEISQSKKEIYILNMMIKTTSNLGHAGTPAMKGKG